MAARPRLPAAALLLGACLAVPLAACAPFTEPSGKVLRDAMGIDVKPEKVGDEAPQISYSAEVLMARAEGYYRERRFADAADTYGRFMELHAAHPWAPYALFRQGMSYVHQIKSADRDPTFAQKARQAFENLIANYPNSDPVTYAHDELAWSIDQLAEHELSIAHFYLRTDRPAAALARLEDLRRAYPDTPAARTALYYLGQAREGTGDTQGAVSAYQAFLESPDTEANRARAQRALDRLAGG
jgi:outer membrane protein assembly factor BamD